MEWTACLRKAIEYMERHLLEDVPVNEIAKEVYVSPFYFQKGFKVMTGVTLTEYIRNRRLYLAALDIIADKVKIIDLALKYGYESPESFSKAFSRFHGVSPTQLRGDASKIRPYLPLKISISISGGIEMDYVVEKMEAFQLIGFKKKVAFDGSYDIIPKFWDEFCSVYMQGKGEIKKQKIVEECMIGEFGVCITHSTDKDEFDYMIAGYYHNGEVLEGMEVYEVPEMEWVKFRCVGPLPGSLQAVNTKIFKEWLPGNEEYEIAAGINLEWYSAGDGSSQDYECGIWVPVKRK